MLQPNDDIEYLFDISNQVKEFYETAVIFITKKDLSDPLFNAFCSIRSALHEGDKHRIIDVIVDFHLQWLRAVAEIENFRKNVVETCPREEVYQSISYTINAMDSRLRYYQRYMDKYRPSLNNEQQVNLRADLEIVEEMHKEVIDRLLDKLATFKNFTCFDEYMVNINEAVDELLTWLDKIYDGLVIKLTQFINVHVPQLKRNLTKTLQQIVEELHTDKTNPVTIKMIEELKKKGKEIGTLIRCTTGHSLELNKVFAKINVLDDRINRLANEPTSAALMALRHKKEFLDKRVASLEKLKMTLKSVHNLAGFKLEGDDEECICSDFYQLKIFNHVLPEETRERLVTELCYLWDMAVFGEKSHQSMISILSAAEGREEFTDDLGTFTIDEHSRKIYKSADGTLLQPNERDELIPLTDDVDHVYFYDDCGRYYIDMKTRQRIYKANSTASEYMMNASGVLLKVMEEREGRVYYYDNCGRYYIDANGKHIYQDEDHLSEYENDGLGNLIRVRSQLDIFEPCPDDAHVTEDFKYLKQSVGPALRKCIADVISHQPADPIKYLSTALVKFRENIELKDKRLREKEEFEVEREIIIAEERAKAERAAMEAALTMTRAGSEASYDSNLLFYTSMGPNDQVSPGSTK